MEQPEQNVCEDIEGTQCKHTHSLQNKYTKALFRLQYENGCDHVMSYKNWQTIKQTTKVP